MKERFDIIASSLSSYFGVGFNTPQEQLSYDLGLEEKVFDEAAQDRMDLGNALEDGCMNYFEKKKGIIIDERNTETRYACDGKLKCKRDGRTFIDGIETGWENKFSNSNAGSFVDDLGYEIQCQAYMMAFGLDQWVLSGVWQGKPQYRLIKKNEMIQSDIEEIVDAVYGILIGISDFEDYPWHIVEKYSKQVQLKTLDDLEEDDKLFFEEIVELKAQEKEIKNRIDELTEYAKRKFEDIEYKDDNIKITIATRSKKGGFDMDRLSIENPGLDLERYRKEDSVYRQLNASYMKK